MVWDIQTIYTLVMAMVPTLVNIFMLTIGLTKILHKSNDIDSIRTQYSLMVKDNAKLRKQINELMTKIDHIKRND